MEDIKMKAFQLYQKFKSFRKVAKLLFGTEKKQETVRRYVKQVSLQSAIKPRQKEIQLPQQLKEKLNLLLLTPIEKKGKTDFMSFSQIFDVLEEKLKTLGFKRRSSGHPPTKYYDFIKNYITKEFGSLERLEQKRRGKKEKAQYNISRHSLERQLGSWEVDATGYTHNGKTYVIVQILDRLTMYMYEPLIIEVKEDQKNKHHNKAINQTILGRYLMTQIGIYGSPKEIISDKDKTITSSYIQGSLKFLNIKHTKKWKPNQKLIERAFRAIKDEVKALIIAGQGQNTDFFQLWKTATKFYNEKPHNFEHIKEPVIPAQLIEELGYGTTPVDEDLLRKAFSEKIEVSVVNNRIRIDGDVYEFFHPELDLSAPLGRKRKYPRVLVERDLENTTKLYVYTLEGQFLGVANLVSKPLSEITAEHKEKKQTIKRLDKKARQLEAQTQSIKEQKQQIAQTEFKETSFEELEIFEDAEKTDLKQEASETFDLDIDVLDIAKLYEEE